MIPGTLWLNVQSLHVLSVSVLVFSWRFSSSNSPQICTNSQTDAAVYQPVQVIFTDSIFSVRQPKTQPFVWLRKNKFYSTFVGGADTNWFGVSIKASCPLAKQISVCVSFLSFLTVRSQEHKAMKQRARLWYLWPANSFVTLRIPG